MLRLVLGVLWICVVGSAWAQDGADAVAPTPVVGTFVGDQYMQTRGGTGGAGGDGGDVLGSVQIDVNLALGSNQAFVYTSSAGWGGAGSGSSPGGDGGDSEPSIAPRDVQPFILGWFSGADFRLAAPGWAVEQSAASRGLRVKVSDPKGKLLATCFLRAT